MSEDFVPYQEALDLKKLGFDEPCFRFYSERYTIDSKRGGDIKMGEFYLTDTPRQKTIRCKAPTFSQAFRWFREKHGIYHIIHCPIKDVAIFTITGFDIASVHSDVELKSYEEAELACLRKLIEIVK